MSVVDGKKGSGRFSIFGKLSKNASQRGPPPLPPKDPVYLAARNRSLASLSPDSLPASPLSGDQYAASSTSAVSLALPKQQRSGLFKFATISRKNSSPNPSTLDSPAADDDENISMPWNFQHNVHVDEGFSGLPPSWTTSLQEAGFSDDEIAAIQQKRLADRPSVRSISPAGAGAGAVVRPVPRSTSLPKNQHTPASSLSASSASMSSASSSPVPEMPSPKVDYAAYMQSPPSPKSPPPTYWRDEPQPLTVRRPPQQPQRQRADSPMSQRSHTRGPSQLSQHSQHSSAHSHSNSNSYSEEEEHDPPTQAPPKPLRSLTLDLDLSVGEPWSDAVLSATPWSASARKEAFDANTTSSSDIKHKANTTKEGSFLPSPSPTSPMFTLTAPGGGRLAASMLEAGADNDDDFSPTAAYYTSASVSVSVGSPGSLGSAGSPRLAYDDEYADEDDLPPSPLHSGVHADDHDHLGVQRDRDNRDSGMSDATMLAPPPSAGVVSRIAVARRAVAEVVSATTRMPSPAPPLPPPAVSVPPPPLPTTTTGLSAREAAAAAAIHARALARANNNNGNGALNAPVNALNVTLRGAPPASPQSSHFGSSGSSESQDHQTPTTEVEAEMGDDTGELDYYLEGKSYLENNGYKLDGAAHRERGHAADHRSGSRNGHGSSERSGSRNGNSERSGSRNGNSERSGSRNGNARREVLEVEQEAEEEEEDEEDRRQREWEAMQRGEGPRPGRRTSPALVEIRPLQTSARASPLLQSARGSPSARTPPMQTQIQPRTPPPTRAPPPPPQPPQTSPHARLMVSATETFGHAQHESEDALEDDAPEDGDDEYEYGYEFPDEGEFGVVAGAVESPHPGPGGYGSAFGSPSEAPMGYGAGAGAGEESRRSGWEEDEEEEEEDEDEEGTLGPKQRAALESGLAIAEAAAATRPAMVITTRRSQLSPGPLTALTMATTPVTPAQRYAGWVAAAVAPLEEFIDEAVDPREFYGDLQEIAEGESGSVFSAELFPDAPAHKLRLPPLVKVRDADELAKGQRVLVAIKSVALIPGGSQKLIDVRKECGLLQGLRCEQVLGMDALYVDVEEDALWIRMELMERSLADVVGLVDEGLRLQEPRIMARFANDMLQALDFLQKHHIAHRDLRSDNLLLNAEGVLKLTDFSNAVRVTPETPLESDPVGVVYWQAPEVRSGAYDPLKIDVWSVGATVWELAEAVPPFSDTQQPAERWPPLTDPALYPPSFHEFLRMCSEPAASRPTPEALLATPFVQNPCGRPVIVQLLSRCMAIEQALHAGDALPDSPP